MTQTAVVFVNYTRSPEVHYPTAIEEAYSITKYISEEGGSIGLDISSIVVAGDSAGGNMATVVAFMALERGGPKIDLQILLYPITNADFNTNSYRQFAEGYWLTRNSMISYWNSYMGSNTSLEVRKNYTASPRYP